MKKVLIVCGVLFFAFVGCSALVFSGSSDDSVSVSDTLEESQPETDTVTEPKAKAKKPKPKQKPLTVKAGTIIREFEENEAAADVKYKGKLLKVKGVVSKVDTDFWNDDEYIVLVNSGSEWDFLDVYCPGQPAEVAASIKKGDNVTLVGTFDDGGDLGVDLKNCSVR